MATEALLTRKSSKKLHTKLALTSDDTKVLGRSTALRREKTASAEQLHTLKLKTHNSAWTPVVHKPSNEQIFKERRDLVSHWFDLWTDSQRKRFLDVVFRQCTRSQHKFVQEWYRERVPLQHLDFTTVLPRFLSLYIFSFLEPKSLCRAAQVSWQWKFLSEQDDVWIHKCLKYGWFLPYKPPDNEFGAWKRHYISCVMTLDYVVGTEKGLMYGTRNDGSKFMKKSHQKMNPDDSRQMLAYRPPWQGPDYRPQDLVKTHFALMHDVNPNEPKLPQSALLFHNRWGILKTKPQGASATSKSVNFEIGLDSQQRRARHRALISGEDYDPRKTNNVTLRESVELQNLEEKRMQELVDTDWKPPGETVRRRPHLGGGAYLGSQHGAGRQRLGGNTAIANPRVIFISSRIPAADLLLDAVSFGVIPIVYEYEGTTTESLMYQLEKILAGRHAQSIGLFCHAEAPGEIRLVHGCTVTMETLDMPRAREFFETVCNHILPAQMSGQFDIFLPLAASEAGMEMLVQLSIITGMQYSSPTGIIGHYNHVSTPWLVGYGDSQPPEAYFCSSKLNVWVNVADQALEALKECRLRMEPFFEKTHRDVAAQLTGQLVFDALGQTDIHSSRDLTQAISEGLKALGNEKNVEPIEFLGRFLLEKVGVEEPGYSPRAILSARSRDKTSLSATMESHGHDSVDTPFHHPPREDSQDEEEEEEEDVEEEIAEEKDDEEDEQEKVTKKQKSRQHQLKDEENMRRQKKSVVLQTQELGKKFGTIRFVPTERLTAQQFADHPEKRTPVAFEILSSELDYMRSLKAIRDVYFRPLKNALSSNRAIISAQNIQIIFTDALSIFEASKELSEDLKDRLGVWNAQFTCLGDIFVKFCSRLKAYTNFTNNYEVILRCVERCKEQTPAFRAFLKRHERVPETKMLTFQELLLLPARRISDYVTLLSWFELHTPRMHPDRQDLENAILTLKELDKGIQECRDRMHRERGLMFLQRRIINSPALLEANRYLIRHQDMALLRPPEEDSEVPELRAYQHVEMLGAYLFNDALILTRRTSKHFPFSRSVEYIYKYETCIGLTRLKISDIPDSKYVQNAFTMATSKRSWTCSTTREEEKVNWMGLVEQTLKSALSK